MKNALLKEGRDSISGITSTNSRLRSYSVGNPIPIKPKYQPTPNKHLPMLNLPPTPVLNSPPENSYMKDSDDQGEFMPRSLLRESFYGFTSSSMKYAASCPSTLSMRNKHSYGGEETNIIDPSMPTAFGLIQKTIESPPISRSILGSFDYEEELTFEFENI